MKVVCEYPDCGREYASRHNLRRHVSSFHLGLKLHECSVCLARLTSKQNLRLHMYQHRRAVEEIPEGAQVVGEIESIPLLTTMVTLSTDPELRPFTTILRVYPFPIIVSPTTLPLIQACPETQVLSRL